MRRTTTALLVALALAVTGCTSTDGDDDSLDPAVDPTTEAETTE